MLKYMLKKIPRICIKLVRRSFFDRLNQNTHWRTQFLFFSYQKLSPIYCPIMEIIALFKLTSLFFKSIESIQSPTLGAKIPFGLDIKDPIYHGFPPVPTLEICWQYFYCTLTTLVVLFQRQCSTTLCNIISPIFHFVHNHAPAICPRMDCKIEEKIWKNKLIHPTLVLVSKSGTNQTNQLQQHCWVKTRRGRPR